MDDPEYRALLQLSARIGADPALVQAAGGNTSIKLDGTLWVKASGLWLRDALTRPLMVPVALAPLLVALGRGDPSAERAERYVIAEQNPQGLRPSIETTMHGMLPQRVVLHVHSVDVIAHAVQSDPEAELTRRLVGIPFAFVPYVRPGLPLTRAIAAQLRPGVQVLVLGNHGLTVAADTVAAAEALLQAVLERLALPLRAVPASRPEALGALAAGTAYRPAADSALHALATDPAALAHAAGGSLYPDHVIFLGPGVCLLPAGEAVATLLARMADAPPLLLAPGLGVLVAETAGEAALAMARCLADVTRRLPAGAALRYLAVGEEAELLGWDAEKYRQRLHPKAIGRPGGPG